METIYIIASNTGSYFSRFLSFFTDDKYVHVSIALDKELNEVYSFGRKHPNLILPAGFVNEDWKKTVEYFKYTVWQIYELEITKKQLYELKQLIKRDYIKNAVKYRYNIRGLPAIQFNYSYQRKYHYLCSQFCGKLLADANIYDFKKDYSLVRPRDILKIKGLKLIYEGKTVDYINQLEKDTN